MHPIVLSSHHIDTPLHGHDRYKQIKKIIDDAMLISLTTKSNALFGRKHNANTGYRQAQVMPRAEWRAAEEICSN